MLRYTGSTASEYSALPAFEIVGDDANSFPVRREFCSDALFPLPDAGPACAKLSNPLARKLEHFAHLSAAEFNALDALLPAPKFLGAGQILIHERSPSEHVYLIVQGMACRYKLLPGGERQILGYLIPGDLCDIHFIAINEPDHSVALLSDAQVIKIPAHRLGALLESHPRIERALSYAALLDMAILREWLLNVGQRNAKQRLSHFFCEMELRLRRIDKVAEDGSFEMPINQRALADTTGITPVHVNRTLQRLRNAGLILLSHRRLAIVDREQLAAVAGFDDNYLQIRNYVK